jgi:hypothetical protein
LFVCSHIRTKTIDGSTDESFLDKFHGVFSSNSLELSLGKYSGINLDTALGSSKGHISDGKFESHQRGEGFNFLQVDVRRVTSASLDG